VERKWQAEVGEPEHRECDQGVGVVEVEGVAGNELDLGVDRVHTRSGDGVRDRGVDPGLLGSVLPPCGPTIERYGGAQPWPWDRYEG
jgi:hypothetical protein